MRHAARGRASPVPSARRAVPGALPGREWRVLVSAAAVLTEPLWTVAAARRFPWGFTGFSGALWRWTQRVPRVGGQGRGSGSVPAARGLSLGSGLLRLRLPSAPRKFPRDEKRVFFFVLP